MTHKAVVFHFKEVFIMNLNVLKSEPSEYMEVIFNSPDEIKTCYKMLGDADSYIMDVEITPEIAQYILDNHDYQYNRKSSKGSVSKYAQAMSQGDFDHRAASISFDEENKLINGRHRINAVIASGQSVLMNIKTGLPHEIISKMDLGRRKTKDNIFYMSGLFQNEIEAKFSQGIVAAMCVIENTGVLNLAVGGGIPTASLDMSEKMMLDYYNENQEYISDIIKNVYRLFTNSSGKLSTKLESPVKLAIYYMILNEIIPAKTDEILQSVFMNIGLKQGCILHDINSYLTSRMLQRGGRARASGKAVFETVMKNLETYIYAGTEGFQRIKFRSWTPFRVVKDEDEDGEIKEIKKQNKRVSDSMVNRFAKKKGWVVES